MARTIAINPDNPQPRLIAQVIDVVQKGGVICYPTDTVYGIGCDIYNQKAVRRIYQIKQRPKNKPFSFMCSSLKNIAEYAHVSNTAYRLMRKNLPGPYTFVLPGTKLVPKVMMTQQKTVGIRVPDCSICLAIIAEMGHPLLNTSASLEGEDAPVSDAYGVDCRFGKQVDLIIDGGDVIANPSSVISLVEDQPEILRAGSGDLTDFL